MIKVWTEHILALIRCNRVWRNIASNGERADNIDQEPGTNPWEKKHFIMSSLILIGVQ